MTKIPQGYLFCLWLEPEPPDQHLLAGGECATLPAPNCYKDDIDEAAIDSGVASTFRIFYRDTGKPFDYGKSHVIGKFNPNEWKGVLTY
ncbi:hypothetical protein [Delftia tsuruhatensis]|uniref:hypothetical protein n=1 Tax=Delftia tsuruhatensis TaxID=180282 RepID=UPI00128D664D|nr:hypothetical protein [Delftia tsuruhatensis]